jgi:hypothetical protein
MAKAKRSKAEAAADDGEAFGAVPGWDIQRVAVHLLIGLGLVGACAGAFYYMQSYVDETVAAPVDRPQIVFKNRPAWMTEVVEHQLAESFRPGKPKSVFDHDVLVLTTKRLRGSPWIEKVSSVRRTYVKGPGDTIEVDCEFRAPMALVRTGMEYWFVDKGGVKLPEKFQHADITRVVFTADGQTNVRVIEGVRSPPPFYAGQHWPGEDLAAGLDLVRRLYGQPFANDIVKVKVDNFGGRIDSREAQIVLVTRYNTEIRWGRAWASTDAFIEVRPEYKMERLRRIVAEYGRVDAKERWIDIRFDKIGCPNPAAATDTSRAQTAGAR